MRPLHTTCSNPTSRDLSPDPSDQQTGKSAGRRPPPFDIEIGRPSASRLRFVMGERVTVIPQSGGDTIGDLVDIVGASSTDVVEVDGRSVGLDMSLSEAGCVHGSRLDIGVPQVPQELTPTSEPTTPQAIVDISVTSGPDCTGSLPLVAGRYVVGRSPSAHIRIRDVRLGLHHAVVDVDTGSVTVTQLSGQAPIRVNGEPVTGTRTISPPARLSIGMNDLWVTASRRSEDHRLKSGSIVATLNDPWRHIVQRGPDQPIESTSEGMTPPAQAEVQRRPPATALIGAAVAVLGAGAIGVVLGQMMFALFAGFGAVASVVTWMVGAMSTWRLNRRSLRASDIDRQRFLDDLTAAGAAARQRHLLMHADLGQVIATADGLAGSLPLRSGVWQRRLDHAAGGGGVEPSDAGLGDAGLGGPGLGGPGIVGRGRATFHPVIGMGTIRWSPTLDRDRDVGPDTVTDIDRAATIHDVAIPVALRAGEVTAISGGASERDALLRSIVCQMAVRHGPADWQLVIVSVDRQKWSWAGWLPHAHTATGTAMLADPTDPDELAALLLLADGPARRPTLLVVDNPALFAVRTGALRRFVERVQPATLTAVDVGAPTPAVCSAVIMVGSTGGVMTMRLDGSAGGVTDAASSVSMCGLSMERAASVARSMARLTDPEITSMPEARLGRSVAMSDLDDVVLAAGGDDAGRRAAVSAICRRWRDGGVDPAPIVAVGESADGVVEVDLVADGPHALVAGTTGSGKSELLRSLVIGLATRLSPEHLTFVLVDYKGGSTFDRCAELPHAVGVVTDLDAGLAERALVSLEAELHRRERMLRELGAVDLTDYRRNPAAQVLPRLVVVIDEFAALAKELPDFLASLVGIAQRGRSLGVHLILATQRPAGVVSDDIRANTNLRLALRLNDGSDAHDVVGDALPATFARDAPGRAALRLGPDELVVFQAARCSGPARGAGAALRVEATEPARRDPPPADGRRVDAAQTELDVAAAVVCAAAQRMSIGPPHRPWIDALPERLPAAMVDLLADAADHDGVGVIDDPAAQGRRVLRWQREQGNLALIGSLGSGTTTAMRAVVAARCRQRPAELEHWYVIDARGEASLDELTGLDHVGAVVRVREQERVHRVIAQLVDEIDRRRGAPLPLRAISLGIDGLSSLRTALSTVENAATLALLERLLCDGPAVGVSACWTDDPSSALRSTSASETWVFRCDDPGVARSFGVAPAGSLFPGHLRVASCGREAVVAADAGLLPPNSRRRVAGEAPPAGSAPSIAVLPANLSAVMFPSPPGCRAAERALLIDVGLRYDDLGVAPLRVPSGDHVFIGGAASTGKSSALRHIARTWQAAHPEGHVIDVDRRRPLVVESSESDCSRPVLVAVDDAERVDDVNGVLAGLVAGAPPGVLIVAAGRLDAVRSAYGHWTRDVARSRCGLILTSAGDVDGDLLGVTLPRRSPLPARPGLAWLVDGAGHRLVQLVEPDPCPGPRDSG